MASFTPKVKFISGPKHQKYCVGSLHMNSWILSHPNLHWCWSFVFQTHCTGEETCSLNWCLQTLPGFGFLHWSGLSCGLGCCSASPTLWDLLHFHLTQLLEEGIEGSELSWRYNGNSCSQNTFQLPSFEAFLKGLDWKMTETCPQKYRVSQKDLLFAPFHYFFSVSFSFSLGISWN